MPGKLCWSRLPLKQWKTFFFVLTYSHLNTRGGWENLRKLCKPDPQHNFQEISHLPPHCLKRECKHGKKYTMVNVVYL